MESKFIRRLFSIFNKFFMIPVFRLGLGSLIGNPFTGYMVVLKTIGHKTGKTRYTPVNYTIWNGSVYCLAGAGKVAHWYRNLTANPAVDLLLPRGAVAAEASEVTDREEKIVAVRQILKKGGFAGFFLGFNPYRAGDEKIHAAIEGIPVIRFQPTGLASGPADGGGWFWVPVWGILIWLILN
jgi:deazaflavin-dependent oxidoreductase (nitroreductase family)